MVQHSVVFRGWSSVPVVREPEASVILVLNLWRRETSNGTESMTQYRCVFPDSVYRKSQDPDYHETRPELLPRMVIGLTGFG